MNRRRFLLAAGLAPWVSPLRAATGRVLVVGGGWGGLAAARHLRRLAPDLEVTLVDRRDEFISFALSNRWLVDFPGYPPVERLAYAQVAATWGYRFVHTEVEAIDPVHAVAHTRAGRLPWDWLVLAPGIREDWSAWQVDDSATVAELGRRHSGAMVDAGGLAGLKRRLAAFRGGDLLLTIPPMPYRCPPAPYERALLIAWWLKARRIPGRLVVIDPNPILPAFRQALLGSFRDQITYLDHARVRAIDPERHTVSTDIDDIHFDEAMLCPPQQAAGLVRTAGLTRGDGGWAAQGALDFRSAADPRIYIVGDATGPVSSLFGHYPKTGHVAARMGAIVAADIAARAAGRDSPVQLPDSICHVVTAVDPQENTRLEASYRLRGDGFVLQSVRTVRDPHPQGDDAAWAETFYRDFLRP